MANYLDRTRHFSTLLGGAEDGAVYTQDGRRFYGSGEEVVVATTEEIAPVKTRAPAKKQEVKETEDSLL